MLNVSDLSETSESSNSEPSSPFRRETPEEILAELGADYQQTFGEIVFLTKKCDESKDVDILTIASEDSFEKKDTRDTDVDEENINSRKKQRNSSGNRNVVPSSSKGDDSVGKIKKNNASDDKQQENISSDSLKEEQIDIRAQYAKKLEAINKEHILKEGSYMAASKKLPFTRREKLIIIYYLIAKNKIMSAKGRDIWLQFMDEGYLPHRTAKSVWNHLMQSLIPQIETFKLPKEVERVFQKLKFKR